MAKDRFRNKIQSLKDSGCLKGLPPEIADFFHDLINAIDGNMEAIKDFIDPLFDVDFGFDNLNFPKKDGDVDRPQPGEDDDGTEGVGGPPPPPPFPTGHPIAGYIFTAITASEITGASGDQPGSGVVALLEMGRPGGNPPPGPQSQLNQSLANGDPDAANDLLRKMEDPPPGGGSSQITLTLPGTPTPPTDPDNGGEDGGDGGGGDDPIYGVAYNIAEGKIKKGKKVILGKDTSDLWWVLVEDCQEPEEDD